MIFEVRIPGSIKGIKILKYLPSSWMSFSFRYQKSGWFLSTWKLHHMRNQQRMLQSTGVKLRVSMHFTAWLSLQQKWIPRRQVSTFKITRQSRLDHYFTHTLALLTFNLLICIQCNQYRAYRCTLFSRSSLQMSGCARSKSSWARKFT